MRRRVSLILFLIATLALSGVAVSSATSGPASFNPNPVHLGTVTAGGHTSQTVTVTNTGDTDMAVGGDLGGSPNSAFSFSGDPTNAFGTSSDQCSGTTLAPNDTCKVDVTFGPNS